MSLSARRAWIEIVEIVFALLVNGVALRKESVDRNFTTRTRTPIGCVALRKESVDRNEEVPTNEEQTERRSPQGERG